MHSHARRFLFRKTDPENDLAVEIAAKKPEASETPSPNLLLWMTGTTFSEEFLLIPIPSTSESIPFRRLQRLYEARKPYTDNMVYSYTFLYRNADLEHNPAAPVAAKQPVTPLWRECLLSLTTSPDDFRDGLLQPLIGLPANQPRL
ncbi:uncharacterized protein TrAtP1_012582 [Trichoderma atroviride]|uniref:uncharacterized protein n=1 Tax=Hypocrea atroviridis TaxID=63577 RepID=UPI00331E95D7|nr:hypothetical protein TrAtP1_012582 [Trichoderma atroviride]